MGNGNELYRVGPDGWVEYDIAPGAASSEPDIFSATEFNGDFVFKATGPMGKELYAADDFGFSLLGDINPEGDAFHLSELDPCEFQGRLYFPAYSPQTGDEIYSTDGTGVEILADIIPGSGDGGYYVLHIPEMGMLLIPAGGQLFVSDGDSVLSMNSAVGDGTTGLADYFTFLLYEDELLFFDKTGEVFRITAVPEPASYILLILGLSLSCVLPRKCR